MVYLGIVGAESPMGKLVIKLLENHSDEYKIVFTVDPSYQTSQQNAQFPNVDDALIMLSATIVIDCGGDEHAFDRVKTYLWYRVPAIMCSVSLSQDELDAITALRKACQKSVPPLVVERELSWSSVLLVEQVYSAIKALAHEVTGVYIDVFGACDNTMKRCLPLMHKINQILGVNENSLQLQQSEDTCALGMVKVEFIGQSADNHPSGESMNVEVCLMKETADTASLKWHFENRADDFWSGLQQLLNFVSHRLQSDADITIDLLPQLLRRCW